MDETQNESVTRGQPVRGKCLNCGDEISASESFRRGLCDKCYQAAHRAMELGQVTWKILEDAKIALPASKGGRPKKRPGDTPLDKLIAKARSAKVVKKAAKLAEPPARQRKKSP